jgi:hypothetical protein
MADFANKSLLLEKQELKKEKIDRVKANITLPVKPLRHQTGARQTLEPSILALAVQQ